MLTLTLPSMSANSMVVSLNAKTNGEIPTVPKPQIFSVNVHTKLLDVTDLGLVKMLVKWLLLCYKLTIPTITVLSILLIKWTENTSTI